MRADEGQMNDPIGRQAAEVGVDRTVARVAVGFIERSREARPRIGRMSGVRRMRAAVHTYSNSGYAVRANGTAAAGIRMFTSDQAGKNAVGDSAGAIPCPGQSV
jgi:hypothetical protein